MSEFRRSSWNFKRRSRILRIRVQSQMKVTGTALTFVPADRMYSCGQAICHASPAICLLSQDAATWRQQEVIIAASSSRSSSFFPRRVKSARGEGGCDNDGSTNEGGNRKGVERTGDPRILQQVGSMNVEGNRKMKVGR